MYKLIQNQLICKRAAKCTNVYRPIMSLFKSDEVNGKRIVNILNNHDILIKTISDALIMLETYSTKEDINKINKTLTKIIKQCA